MSIQKYRFLYVGNQAAVDQWGDYCLDLRNTKVAGELNTDAYNLYKKNGGKEIIGVIPNFVTMTKDGKVIVYDGSYSLYKIPLFTEEQLIKTASERTNGMDFNDYQREMYHLFS